MATITTPLNHFSIMREDKVDEPIKEPKYPPLKTAAITGRNVVILIKSLCRKDRRERYIQNSRDKARRDLKTPDLFCRFSLQTECGAGPDRARLYGDEDRRPALR